MAKKLPVKDMLRLACLYAEDDLESHALGLAHCKDETSVKVREDALALLAQIRAYRIKRWGQTSFEKEVPHMKSMNVLEAISRALPK